jgi:hypothetical protein
MSGFVDSMGLVILARLRIDGALGRVLEGIFVREFHRFSGGVAHVV